MAKCNKSCSLNCRRLQLNESLLGINKFPEAADWIEAKLMLSSSKTERLDCTGPAIDTVSIKKVHE